MRGIGWKLVVALVAAIAPASLGKPTFAGWIRQASGSVQVRSAGTDVVSIDAKHARGLRLFAGQEVKGTATLLIYGHQFDLKAAKGWYLVPDDAKKAPPGRDIYAKYILRAGRTRNDRLNEQLWQAITISELANPTSNYQVQIRVTPVKKSYRVGDRIAVKVKNDSPRPLYFSVMDIDCEGHVARIIPRTEDPRPVKAKSGWTRIGNSFLLALPAGWKQGTEQFKVVATEKPIDLSIFDTDNLSRHIEVLDPDLDPLQYLMRTLGSQADPGQWTTALAEFTIRK